MGSIDTSVGNLQIRTKHEPHLDKTYTLKFIGDWGLANFHRICSWLTQEFCDRAGPQSQVAIWNMRDDGLNGIQQVAAGEAHLAVATPAGIMSKSRTGGGYFPTPLPKLRALAVLPQNDRMVFAVDPKYNVRSFADLFEQKPALTIATSINGRGNSIGFVADHFLDAHGLTRDVLDSWGVKMLRPSRPEQCTALVESGKADALLQEAIMTPWWRELVENNRLVPLPAEADALAKLKISTGLETNILPKGFWSNLDHDLPALDFSDFVLFVNEDLPEEVAYLLTWILVERKELIEQQYRHLPPQRSPLSYPLNPRKMCKTPVPLHPGARRFYEEGSYLE